VLNHVQVLVHLVNAGVHVSLEALSLACEEARVDARTVDQELPKLMQVVEKGKHIMDSGLSPYSAFDESPPALDGSCDHLHVSTFVFAIYQVCAHEKLIQMQFRLLGSSGGDQADKEYSAEGAHNDSELST
jgi:hypothetical protein